MRFRFLEMLVPSPRAQRRLQRVGSVALMWVGYPFRLLFGLAKATGQLVASWWDSRNLRYLLQGLPALVIAIALLVVGAMIFFTDRAALAQEYESQGIRALTEARVKKAAGQDFKAPVALAQTCYKRLSQPSPTPRNTFHMAETYVLQRQFPAAASIQESLAPLDPKKPGYGPAHFEVARRLLASNPTPKQILEAENHLRQAYMYGQGGSENREEAFYAAHARAVLFEVLRDTNRPEEAEIQLVEAVNKIGNQEPDLRIQLAIWYMRTDRRDQAEDQAKKAVDSFSKRVDENPNDLDAQANLIKSLKFSGGLKCARGDYKKGKEDFTRAREYCFRGIAMTTDQALQKRYLDVMCYVYLQQFDDTFNDANTTAAERFGLLEQALGLRPYDPNLIQRLGRFMLNSGPEAEKARVQIQRMVDEGKHIALGHMILGTAAWEKGDFVTAQHHWEKAFEQNDWAPLVANNLAWLLAFKLKPPDPARGLMIVDQALLKAPDVAQFHGTRGHILAVLGRYNEALPELERALPAFVNNNAKETYQDAYNLYKRLAEVCLKLGMVGEAKRYEKLADDVFKKAKDAAVPGGAVIPAAVPDAKNPAAPAAPKP
jgi:tetratricopeptide (TPR) repeat protein